MTQNPTKNIRLSRPNFNKSGWHDDLNDNFTILDTLLYSVGLTNVKGTWTNSTDYAVDDRVIDVKDYTVWRNKVAHTTPVSGTFADERTVHPTYWEQNQFGFTIRGPWKPSETYSPGDLVFDATAAVIALCVTRHVSTTSIQADEAYWTFIIDLGTFIQEILDTAGNIVAQGNVPIYTTFDAIPTLTIPTAHNSIFVKGGATVGDVELISLRKVGANPGHPGAKQSADGAWWEIVADRLPWGVFGADIDIALPKAITTANAINACVTFPRNKFCKTANGILITDESVDIDMQGATLARAATGANDFRAFEHTLNITNVNPVVGVTFSTWDYSLGTAGSSPVSRLDMGSSAVANTYAVGQNVKIVAEDKIPSSDPTNNERVGEIFTIGAISGQYIYALGVLVETYTTVIRLGAMSTKKSRVVHGFITDEVGSTTLRRKAAFTVRGIVDGNYEDLLFSNLLTMGMERHSCFRTITDRIRGYKLRTYPSNDPSPGVFATWAYVIARYGDNFGHDNCVFCQECRHGVTSGGRDIGSPTGADLLLFGGSLYGKTTNGKAIHCGNCPWDNHPDAKGETFSDCDVYGGFNGVIGANYGFQIRGRDCVINGGLIQGARGAIIMQGYGSHGGNHVVRGLVFERPLAKLTSGSVVRIDATDMSVQLRASIQMTLTCIGGVSPLIECIKADITPDSSFDIRYDYTTGAAPRIVTLQGTRWRGKLVVDASRGDVANASAVVVFDSTDGTNDVVPEYTQVTGNAATKQISLVDLGGFDGTFYFPRGDIPVGALASSNQGFLNVGAGAKIYQAMTLAFGQKSRLDSLSQTLAVGNNTVLMPRSGHQTLKIHVGCPTAGAVINALEAGKVDGQIAYIMNDNAPGGTVLVTHNLAGLIDMGNSTAHDATMNVFGVLGMCWDKTSGVWRPVSGYRLV